MTASTRKVSGAAKRAAESKDDDEDIGIPREEEGRAGRLVGEASVEARGAAVAVVVRVLGIVVVGGGGGVDVVVVDRRPNIRQ